jgi:hypothetical protein
LEDPPATLPNDDDLLAGYARVSREEWEALKPDLMSQFCLNSAGRLFNDRQMEEWKKQQSRRTNGSKGGSKRQANRVANGVATVVAINEDENELERDQDQGGGAGELLDFKKAFAMTQTKMVAEDFCKLVYDDWTSRFGRDGNGVEVDWLRYVCKRWDREGASWMDGTHKGKQVDGKPPGGQLPVWKQVEALKDQISKHPANRSSVFENPKCTELERAAYKALKQKLAELEAVK